MTLRKRIPPLAFGNGRAIEFDDPEKMGESLFGNGRDNLSYRPLDPAVPFLSRAFMVKTENAQILALASTAAEIEACADSSIGLLLLPLSGSTVVEHGTRSFEWGVSAGPAFLPSDRYLVRANARSAIGIDIDPVVTERLLRSMLGEVPERTISSAIDHATPRVLPRGRGGGPDLAEYLLRHIASFDAIGCDPQLIQRSGLDDAILRCAILHMCPDLLAVDTGQLERQKSVVDFVCDYIEANLTSRITLTDLERVSGLSARRLQYAFRAAFDKTPMQWVTERRLEAVRKKILSAQHGSTVTWIAVDYFTNLGEFARLYREKFGELPSDTLKNVLSRRRG